jgi:hypothetical protein
MFIAKTDLNWYVGEALILLWSVEDDLVCALLRCGFWIAFIDTLYTALGTTGNDSAVANLHTLQFTDANALGFSVCYILH